ncbi:MAG: amidohydrolase [Lysobacterales bacterium]
MTQTQRGLTLASIGLALLLAACSESPPPPTPEPAPPSGPQPADLVLRGGHIATVDEHLGEQQALAVRGFEIVAVGSDADVQALIGPQTEVIELAGRRVIPGFIEGHGHFLSLGQSKQILDLTGVQQWSELEALVTEAVTSAEPGSWILGRGWHQGRLTSLPADAVDGVPTNAALNAVSPDHPVLLGHASGHAAFANDAALAAAGIDADTPDPDGGTIVRDASGRATGLLRETAQRLVGEALARSTAGMSPAQRALQLRERAELAGQEALRFGVTSFHDAGASFAEIDLFRQLAAEGALPVRLYVMVRGESNEAMDRMLSAYRTLPSGNDFLAVRSIKRQLDGALGAHGAWLLEPYSDLPDSTGLVLEPLEEIARTAEIAIKHGFQLNTHAIGDRANRELLDLYQQAWVDHGADGRSLRWRIEHAQHVAPVDQPRFAELGIIAAVQGIHCSSDGPWVPTRLGEPRTGDTSYRWRSLIDSGALVGNGTDVPVEPIDPIASYYASVTRMMANGEAFHAEQRMNRDEALASYTINNAIASFDEGRVGSIKPGKLADIVVLSADILTIDAAQIPQAQVDFTIVGGAVRYRREDSKEP